MSPVCCVFAHGQHSDSADVFLVVYTRNVYDVREELNSYDDAQLACGADGNISDLAHPRVNQTQQDLLTSFRYQSRNETFKLLWVGLVREANGDLMWSKYVLLWATSPI